MKIRTIAFFLLFAFATPILLESCAKSSCGMSRKQAKRNGKRMRATAGGFYF